MACPLQELLCALSKIEEHSPTIICIQRYWRGSCVRKKHWRTHKGARAQETKHDDVHPSPGVNYDCFDLLPKPPKEWYVEEETYHRSLAPPLPPRHSIYTSQSDDSSYGLTYWEEWLEAHPVKSGGSAQEEEKKQSFDISNLPSLNQRSIAATDAQQKATAEGAGAGGY